MRVVSAAVLAAAPLVGLALAPFGCTPSPFVVSDGTDASTDDAPSLPVVVPSYEASDGAPGGPGNGAGGNACSPPGVGAVANLGCVCRSQGATACAGNAQKEELICQSGTWVANGRCPDGQLCDTGPGPTQGSCAVIADGCAALSPGQSFCSDPATRVQCGMDLVTSMPTICALQTCVDGGCIGVCMYAGADASAGEGGPGLPASPVTTHCSGSMLQECDVNGAWADFMTCPVTCCDDRCTDSTSDPANCGACGHTCQGAQCVMGVCQATPVAATNDGSVLAGPIAIDAHNVYVTTSSGVMSAPILALGAALQPVAGNRSGAFDLVTDGVDVYWTEPPNGLVLGVPVAGGTPFTVASGQDTPTLLALGTSTLYWSASTGSGGGAILSVPLTGLAVADAGVSPATVFSGAYPIVDLALDSPNLYFAQSGCHPQAGSSVCSYAIASLPLGLAADGGAPAPVSLASGSAAVGLAAGPSAVYWTTAAGCSPANAGSACDGGLVESVGLEGGAPQTLASQQGSPGPIVVDDSSLYVGAASVIAVPLDGGVPATLQPGAIASGFAQDSEYLYWTELTSGSVMRLAKR